MAAREDLSRQLENRRVELPSTEEIKAYVADFREFLQQGTIPERKALIRNFVQDIEVVGDQATLTYTVPMPTDGATKEDTSVRYFANSGLPPVCHSEPCTGASNAVSVCVAGMPGGLPKSPLIATANDRNAFAVGTSDLHRHRWGARDGRPFLEVDQPGVRARGTRGRGNRPRNGECGAGR